MPASAVRSVSPVTRSIAATGYPERVGCDLAEDRVGALADVDRTAVEDQPARARQPEPDGRGMGQGGVADAVPHAADANALPLFSLTVVELLDHAEQLAPARLEGFQAGGEADARLEPLTGRGQVPGAQRVAQAEPEPVDAEAQRQIVDQRLVGDRGLGHAEAAKGAGRRAVGEDRAGADGDVRHAIGSGRVDRHPPGDRRSPGGVGAGVEIGARGEGPEAAFRIAAEARPDARRMALGRARHALGALVDQGDRPLDQGRGEREQRLHREIELAAEAAAAGRGQDAHPLRRDAQHARGLVAVEIGRLRRDVDLDPLADAARPAGLGLDVGMLDEGRGELALGDRRALRERGLAVARADDAPRSADCRACRPAPAARLSAVAASRSVTAGSGR